MEPGESNPRPVSKRSGKARGLREGAPPRGANCGAPPAHLAAEAEAAGGLQVVAEVWDRLPPALRAGIEAMARAGDRRNG